MSSIYKFRKANIENICLHSTICAINIPGIFYKLINDLKNSCKISTWQFLNLNVIFLKAILNWIQPVTTATNGNRYLLNLKFYLNLPRVVRRGLGSNHWLVKIGHLWKTFGLKNCNKGFSQKTLSCQMLTLGQRCYMNLDFKY